MRAFEADCSAAYGVALAVVHDGSPILQAPTEAKRVEDGATGVGVPVALHLDLGTHKI